MTRAGGYATVALVGALLLGGALGYTLGRGTQGPERMKQPMTMLGLSRTALLDSLEATPAQRAAIDSLLDRARGRADSAVDRMMTDVRAATREARDAVRALLDEPQRRRFDSLLAGTREMLPRSPVPPR